MAFTIITQGSFTSAGIGVRIPLPSSADYFKVTNLTQLATTQASGRGFMFEWYGNGLVAADNAIEWSKTDATNVANMELATSGGFTYVTVAPYVEAQAANAITAISLENPAVVSQVHSYSDGDIVRIYNTTGELQIGGMDFQISSSSSGTSYTLLGLPNTAANGFSAATAGYTRRLSKFAAVEPEFLYITNIQSAANLTSPGSASQSVVSVSVDPALYYAVGMKVHFSVPSSCGMTEINGLTGTILALNVGSGTNIASYNFTVDIDCSAFTAFAFPASSKSPTSQLFPTVAPAGAKTAKNFITGVQTGYDFNFQPFRTGQFVPYMYLAAGIDSPAGSADDVIVWQAYKMEATFYS